jgi:undecaprenyl-diphosphatase
MSDVLNDIAYGLENFDVNLFHLVNEAHSPVADEVMWWLSQKLVWIPLYALMAFLVYRSFGWKGAIAVVLAAGCCVVITDQVSVHAFKNVFERLRPCHNLDYGRVVHTVNDHCGGQYGFISSHAANVFGIAVFVGRMVRHKYKSVMIGLVIWAALVSYSRVYLGVHYPADVVGGALLGITVGFSLSWVMMRFREKLRLGKKPAAV